MIQLAIFFLAFGVVGIVYGFTGRSVANNPPTGHSIGATRARSLARMSPRMLRSSVAALVLGLLLLVIGLAVR